MYHIDPERSFGHPVFITTSSFGFLDIHFSDASIHNLEEARFIEENVIVSVRKYSRCDSKTALQYAVHTGSKWTI